MGLSPATFKGLKKKNFEKKSFGDALIIPKGGSVPVQFLVDIDEFDEYWSHNWKDGNTYHYVPCAGDECELCQEEDRDIKKQSYAFATNVIAFEEDDNGKVVPKVRILTGPKDLAGRLFERYEKNPDAFVKRIWDIKKFNTSPVTYDVDRSEMRAINPASFKQLDIEKYLAGQMERFFGEDDKPKVKDLDDAEWEPWEEVPEEEAEDFSVLEDANDFDPENDFAEFEAELEKEEEPEPPKKRGRPAAKKGE